MPVLHHSDHAIIELEQLSLESANAGEGQDPCDRTEESIQPSLELIQECIALIVLFVLLKTVLLDHLT